MKIGKRKGKAYIGLLAVLATLCSGCNQKEDQRVSYLPHTEMNAVPVEYAIPSQEQLIEAYVEQMTLEEKVGQLFYVTLGNLAQPEGAASNGIMAVDDDETAGICQYHPGGIILMGSNIETDEQVQELTSALQDNTSVPLFIGVDEEGGMVSRLGSSAGISMSNVGSMQAIGTTGDPSNAYAIGETLANNLQGYGFNMDFAPVADVLTNPYNYEIGSRSFGSDASLVADMVSQEITGLQNHGISAVAKHFPGHGGVIGNSHNNLQYVETSIGELRQREFLPFQAAIEADVDFILVSHLVLTDAESEYPSTLSEPVVTGLLREELGYEGVIITDSFQMGSITENYSQGEAAVLAVQAGCDMILMPSDYAACYQGILEAVQDGRITQEQLDESCMRIIRTKVKRGILILS